MSIKNHIKIVKTSAKTYIFTLKIHTKKNQRHVRDGLKRDTYNPCEKFSFEQRFDAFSVYLCKFADEFVTFTTSETRAFVEKSCTGAQENCSKSWIFVKNHQFWMAKIPKTLGERVKTVSKSGSDPPKSSKIVQKSKNHQKIISEIPKHHKQCSKT